MRSQGRKRHSDEKQWEVDEDEIHKRNKKSNSEVGRFLALLQKRPHNVIRCQSVLHIRDRLLVHATAKNVEHKTPVTYMSDSSTCDSSYTPPPGVNICANYYQRCSDPSGGSCSLCGGTFNVGDLIMYKGSGTFCQGVLSRGAIGTFAGTNDYTRPRQYLRLGTIAFMVQSSFIILADNEYMYSNCIIICIIHNAAPVIIIQLYACR
jgi:hypothetical protein